MFDVKMKETNEFFKVFAVQRNSNNITKFLLYKNGKWEWESSDKFEPAFIDLNYLIQNMYKENIPFLAKTQKEINEIMLSEEGGINA